MKQMQYRNILSKRFKTLQDDQEEIVDGKTEQQGHQQAQAGAVKSVLDPEMQAHNHNLR